MAVKAQTSPKIDPVYACKSNCLTNPQTSYFENILKLKALDGCAKVFDRERPLITDKHTEIFDCIPCVMVLLVHSASRAQILTTTRPTFDLEL